MSKITEAFENLVDAVLETLEESNRKSDDKLEVTLFKAAEKLKAKRLAREENK